MPASATLSAWQQHPWSEGVSIDQLSPLDRLIVCTRHSTYEIVSTEAGSAFGDLGLSTPTANQLTGTIGLLLALALVAGVYRVGIVGMQRLVRVGHQRDAMAGHFAHTLVPIAVAYVVAHYFSLVALQGQALFSLASDPLGNGSNIFGTASASVNYALLSAGTICAVQVIALVSGGFGRAELEEAGADVVCDDSDDLRHRIDDLLLRSRPGQD